MDDCMQPCCVFASTADGLAWSPQAVIVGSISSRHADDIAVCLLKGLPVLAEKPLVISHDQLDLVREAWRASVSSHQVVVGCNLRYLPSLRRVFQELKSGRLGRLIRAQLEVGQDLRQWRPNRDLANSYSAQADSGGGVVFDLVHEIDMALWLLGPLTLVAAVGERLSDLPITVDDVHVALLRTQMGTPVSISLDYVSKQLVRRYVFVGDRGTLIWDLVLQQSRILDESGAQLLDGDAAAFDMTATYAAQMQDWLEAIKDPAHRVISPLTDAIETTELMLKMKDATA